MKYKKLFILLLASGTLLLSGCGKKKNDERKRENITGTVVRQDITEEKVEEETAPAVIRYRVILSGEKLSLYEINGEQKRLITAMDIDSDFYPSEDIKRLKNGIETDFLEDGYEILENFAN